LVDEADGAFWPTGMIESGSHAISWRLTRQRAVRGCGIVVPGIVSQGPIAEWKIYVLEDANVQGLPNGRVWR